MFGMGLFDVKKFASAIVDLVWSQPPMASTEANAEAAAKAAAVEDALAQVRAGETIPADEVEAWIESCDTPRELPVPTPRRR